MRFEFSTAQRIIFGEGAAREIASIAVKMGKKILLVTGANLGRAEWLIKDLKVKGLDVFIFQVDSEPTTDCALDGIALSRETECDLVIGIGGGSVIDTGKVIASLLTNKGDLFDYLEVIGAGQEITNVPAPYVAVPTTAGTGAEVTKNAVLISPEHKVKVSMRSVLMLPKLAVIDPELTYSMPPEVTASTGLDAFTQVMEPYVSIGANPFTDSICREGLMHASRSLRVAYEDGKNKAARQNMALASLFGGLALANAKLGAVHGFAAPLGGKIQAPHGAICARLLPYVMEANIKALMERASDSPALKKYEDIARIITGKNSAEIQGGVSWVKTLCNDLNIQPLSVIGLKEEHIKEVVADAKASSSMKGNPIALTDAELADILAKAM